MTASNANSVAFTVAIDRRIIRGFLGNRESMIERLTRMGFKRSAIFERAKKLGLSDQFVKKCAVGKPNVALRPCLGCNEMFLSVGFQNRLCPRCRNRS